MTPFTFRTLTLRDAADTVIFQTALDQDRVLI